MKKPTATQRKVKAAFEEVHENTPKAVKHTARKFGVKRAEKQRTAIALSKARAAGAHVPLPPNFETQNALHVPMGTSSGGSHAGERVTYQKNTAPACDYVKHVPEHDHKDLKVPEHVRHANNQARDARTNLGRGKPAHVEVD